jgi:hypothetical protein
VVTHGEVAAQCMAKATEIANSVNGQLFPGAVATELAVAAAQLFTLMAIAERLAELAEISRTAASSLGPRTSPRTASARPERGLFSCPWTGWWINVSGSLPHYKIGPASYQVSALVTGGMLVAADGAGVSTVSPAGAGSALVLGVAGNDAAPIPNQAGATDTAAGGAPLVDISVLPDYCAVYGAGYDMHVTYAANTAFGALLKAAANGQVTTWVSGTDAAGLIVGRCTQPGGVVTATNVLGRMRTFV